MGFNSGFKGLIYLCNCQPFLLPLPAKFYNSQALNFSSRKMLHRVFIFEVFSILGSLSMKQNHQTQKQDRRVFSLVVFDNRYKQTWLKMAGPLPKPYN